MKAFIRNFIKSIPGVVPAIYKTRKKVASVPTTNLIERIDFNTGRYIQYSYDESNNVMEMFDSTKGTTKYYYDTLGQLISEVRNNDIISTMTYDNYGNILTKNGKEYTYDTVWKDKLISYDGSPIVYDDCGNPLSLLGATLSWKWGKRLASFTNSTCSCSYDYDSYGIRISKAVNGVVHNYLLNGYKILAETWGNNALIPLYDNDDVVGIIYNNIVYYFVKNQFNDVLEILDADGNQLVEYTYDAWGKCNILRDASNSSIGTINPYRYRGYYYDQETELYYLQTRYYSSELGRFLNCDSVNVLKIYAVTFSNNNTYFYAANSPITKEDRLGLCSYYEYGQAYGSADNEVFPPAAGPILSDEFSLDSYEVFFQNIADFFRRIKKKFFLTNKRPIILTAPYFCDKYILTFFHFLNVLSISYNYHFATIFPYTSLRP